MMTSELHLDGSDGEGGGQILRTALALSILTGTPFSIDRIRANRSKPGLMRQHLTAVNAATTVGNAVVEGAALGSRALSFRPQGIIGGHHRFAVGSAGSACLVFQTVVFPLLFADGPSQVVFEGGTHNTNAPPFDFIARAFLLLMLRMGANMSLELERIGFFPAGGGRFRLNVDPVRTLRPLELLEAGPVRARRARALVANVPGHVAVRELAVVKDRLRFADEDCRPEVITNSAGPGNVLFLELERPEVTEVITGFGDRGTRAEAVAERAVREAGRYLSADVPVGEHLQDQLIIPLALAGGGAFRTLKPSQHTLTNIQVVKRFLPVEFEVTDEREDRATIRVMGRAHCGADRAAADPP